MNSDLEGQPRWRGHRAGFLALALLAALMPAAPRAETMYVSDELVITFRGRPSTQGEILRNLAAGTNLEVLEMKPEEEWARVRLNSGLEGWVRKQYLTPEPVARDRLAAANRDVERLTRSVTDLRERLETVQSARSEAEQSSTSLASQVSRLEQELAEIKRVSAGAIETATENRRLNDLNARLRAELDELVQERDQLIDNAQQRWLLLGGGLVLAGLLLGIVIKARPRRSAWS